MRCPDCNKEMYWNYADKMWECDDCAQAWWDDVEEKKDRDVECYFICN